MPKTILHVDINSYFATLLQQENPALRGRPLGVTKGEGRTCLIATSKEAKKYGIKTGMRLKEALPLYPQLITAPAEFERYLDATKRLKKLFESIAPNIFIYSLDEAFIDISDCRKNLYQKPHDLSELIQQKIRNELGDWVTCNVGIAQNRLLAKMASEIAGTNSILEITEKNLDNVLAEVKFGDVCGVGFRLEKKLALLNVFHPYQIRFIPEEELAIYFGPFWSKELIKIAYGEETHLLSQIDRPLPHMKSVSRSITGYRLYDDEEEIKGILYNLIEEVTFKARKMNLAGRHVSIYLRGQESSWGAHKTLPAHIRHSSEMFQVLYYELYKNWDRDCRIIKFVVRLSLLEPLENTCISLFDDWERKENISKALDAVNGKYGLFTVRSGALLNRVLIKPEVTGFLGDRTYQLG